VTGTAIGALQALDTENDRARRQVRELEARIADDANAEAARAAEQQAGEALRTRREVLREREAELKSLESRMGALDQKLYSGKVQNPKELASYERELQMFKQNRDRLEETVLGLMDESEQAERAAGDARAAREQAEADRQDACRGWQAEVDVLNAQIAERSARMTPVRAAIGIDTLDSYDRLRRRMPMAAAPVRHGVCAACGIGVSADVQARAQAEDDVALCDNCGRILYAG